MIAAVGRTSPLFAFSALHVERVMDALQRSVPTPEIEIVEQRAARRKVFRDRSPLTTRAQNVHQPIDHVAHDNRPLAAAPLARRNEPLDKRPFLVGQIARVTQLVAVVAGAIFGRPHGHLQNESVPRKESQQIPALQAAASPNRFSRLAKSPDGHLEATCWVTRQGVHIDRIACAWLIRRFIDDEAVFKFVLPRAPCPRARSSELRFDMFDAEFTHEGDNCSFEVLMAHAGLNDLALQSIAEIVHEEIDLKDEKFGREETAGVRTLINGICADTHDDEERIARGSVIFEGLYSSFRKKKPSRPSATSQTKKL